MTVTYQENPEFRDAIRKGVADAVSRAAIGLQSDLKKTLSKSASPSRPGSPPGAETGNLRRSVQSDLGTVRKDLRARVGTNIHYGRTLEYGARIRPKKAKTLAVPITKEAQRHASPRRFPRELQLIPRKGRAPLLAEVDNDKVKPHYVLMPSVNIAPRPWLRPTAKKFAKRFVSFFDGVLK